MSAPVTIENHDQFFRARSNHLLAPMNRTPDATMAMATPQSVLSTFSKDSSNP